MNCPNCHTTLVIADRQAVEIDYCPNCRGVWLDRGELDKIIEGAARYQTHAHSGRRHDYDERERKPYKKKRESFLGELFDF